MSIPNTVRAHLVASGIVNDLIDHADDVLSTEDRRVSQRQRCKFVHVETNPRFLGRYLDQTIYTRERKETDRKCDVQCLHVVRTQMEYYVSVDQKRNRQRIGKFADSVSVGAIGYAERDGRRKRMSFAFDRSNEGSALETISKSMTQSKIEGSLDQVLHVDLSSKTSINDDVVEVIKSFSVPVGVPTVSFLFETFQRQIDHTFDDILIFRHKHTSLSYFDKRTKRTRMRSMIGHFFAKILTPKLKDI